MTRKKREWYKDASYHVMARGNRRTAIFRDHGVSIPLEKCSLFGVSLHPIPEKEASLSGTECRVFMSKN